MEAAECCGKAHGLDRGWRVDGQPPSDLHGRAWKGRHTCGAHAGISTGSWTGLLREAWGRGLGAARGPWSGGSVHPMGCPSRGEVTRCPGRGLEQPPESPVPWSCRFPSPEGGATWWGPTASCGEGGFPSPLRPGPQPPQAAWVPASTRTPSHGSPGFPEVTVTPQGIITSPNTWTF